MKRAKVCALTLAILISIAAGSTGTYAQEAAPCYPCMQGVYGTPGAYASDAAPVTIPVTAPVMPIIFAGEALFMFREDPSRHSLVQDVGASNADVVNLHEMVQDTGLGMRFTATMRPGWSDIEVVYFGITDWGNTRSLAASGTGYVLPDLNDTNYYTDAVAIYDSKLYNGEVNLRCPLFDCLTGIMGFRWAELKEHAGVWGTSVDSFSGDVSNSWSISRTTNDLFGFQIGGDLAFGFEPGRYISATVKGGVYSNQVRWQRDAVNELEGTSDARDQYEGRVAFVGEVAVRGTWELTSHLSAFCGYQVMWLSGVALAPDQLDTTLTTITSDRTQLFHGAMAGAETRW